MTASNDPVTQKCYSLGEADHIETRGVATAQHSTSHHDVAQHRIASAVKSILFDCWLK